MNINECGCRPYGWLGLDGDRCIRVIPRHKRIHLWTLMDCFFSIQCNLRVHLLLQGEEDDGEYDEDADPDFVPQV